MSELHYAPSKPNSKKPKLGLETSVQYLKGIGPQLAKLFAKRDIHTVKDLLHYYPRAFEDRRAARNIRSLQPGDLVSVKAQVIKLSSFQMGSSKRRIYDLTIQDGSGLIHCKFFRTPYRGYFDQFQAFSQVRVVGKVIDYRGRLEFHHPEVHLISSEEEEEVQDSLLPIYPEIESLGSNKIHRLIQSVLAQLEPNLLEEKLPASLLSKYDLVTLRQALDKIHKPDPEFAEQYNSFRSKAQRRLIFEEFFWLELVLASRKSDFKKEAGLLIREPSRLAQELEKSLPFRLTAAQKKCFAEIQRDMATGHPMNRLVQGDVGSGKTLVALLAATSVIESAYQACLMAPTEILAEQHFLNSKRYLEPLGFRLALLTGKSKSSERKLLLEKLSKGEIDLLIGTHALIEDEVQFQSLALVIVDEQHRFGVDQRASLKQKGKCPHFLVMTATPIPRTLAMTVYGDLDVSTINEMPLGRSPIQTRVIYESKRKQCLDFIRDQVQRGRQAYIVYPLVEESEKIDLKNAVEEFEKLKTEFSSFKLGLLHGRLKNEEKDQIMQAFRNQEIQILVATTVIEVGVDVPNANIMVIEHAERFGLSQLHQLRGRVGRGVHKSFCVMILGHAISQEARERVQFMESTTDGFKIAEFDLQLRGPGEFLGRRQSGLSGFKLASLIRDQEILQQAREAAFAILHMDPRLERTENKGLREELTKTHGISFIASIA